MYQLDIYVNDVARKKGKKMKRLAQLNQKEGERFCVTEQAPARRG